MPFYFNFNFLGFELCVIFSLPLFQHRDSTHLAPWLLAPPVFHLSLWRLSTVALDRHRSPLSLLRVRIPGYPQPLTFSFRISWTLEMDFRTLLPIVVSEKLFFVTLTLPWNCGGVTYSWQFVYTSCVCKSVCLSVKECTYFDAVLWLLFALAQALLKLVSLGQWSKSFWPKKWFNMTLLKNY